MTVEDVLVVGATGTQGGAVVDALQTRTDLTVHALTRKPSEPAAIDLQKRGVAVVQGDLSDEDRLRELFEDVDAIFGVTDFWEHGYEDEIQHGRNLARAAADVNIEHLVFSSVGGAERDTGIPHFDSKFEVERTIDELGLPATIVRPVFFMQNLEGMREQVSKGTLAMGLRPRVPLQLLDVEDLGAFVAEAFTDPDRYRDEAFELASDELTLQAMAARLGDVTGNRVRAEHLTIDEVRSAAGEESAVMFDWFNEHGYEAGIADLRADHDVTFGRLETYLEREGWAKLD